MQHREGRRMMPLVLVVVAACASSDPRPVELYPEDACSSCRMAISDPAFASEILTEDGEALKFDDLGCLENFRKSHPESNGRPVYVIDVVTHSWLARERSIIVRTGIETPMGSGLVAVSSDSAARRLLAAYPAGADAMRHAGE